MKQLVQDLVRGDTSIVDTPSPACGPGRILIQTKVSLVSPGTERMLVEFGRAGWVSKARQQPDKVRQLIEKVRTDGIVATAEAVRSKLDVPLPLGYSNVGVVRDIGAGVDGFSAGDRVVSNGPHAEMVCIPKNLCARIPDGVSDEAAAFTVIGAIGLQGLRLAQPTLGECFVVTGLGLIGLMTVQLLQAHGCRVLGIDPDPEKRRIARTLGAEVVAVDQGEDPIAAARQFSRGRGVDGVLLTLASKNSEPVAQAARMCRKRGRIVLVGVTGLELSRADFYEKELSFQVSCSYGPGRYDPFYEEKGQDYPIGFVRWTEQRNFEAVLDMMATRKLDVEPLISHRFEFAEAPKAYDLLTSDKRSCLGILLSYGGGDSISDRTVRLDTPPARREPEPGVSLGFVGAGNYAGRVLIPAFARTQAELTMLANSGSVNGVHYGRRYRFREVTTDVARLLDDKDLNAVVIASRHDSHARLVVDAVRNGKHVFCEKPLALTQAELNRIQEAWNECGHPRGLLLMVGFNRRFSPLTDKMRAMLRQVHEPKSFIITVNAGAIPKEHWTQDPEIGGGRIIGEACHFIDLMRYLAGAPITRWHVQVLGRTQGADVRDDKATITLEFEDGSIGTVHYLANGHKAFPKERVEVFCADRVLQLDNFRSLRGFGWPGFRQIRLLRQDKGQGKCAEAFVEAVRVGSAPPIPYEELIEVSRVAIEVGEAARG